MDVAAILDTWRQVFTVDFLRYFLTAAPFYLVFWVWRPTLVRGRRLQLSDPERARVLSEVAYSLSTVVIFSAVGLCLLYAQEARLTRIYLNVAERGWFYLWTSIVAAIVAHDAYFYWTHRLLHWRPLYRLAHHVHHRSTSPTPWAAYAFHPLEAVVQAGVYVLTRWHLTPTHHDLHHRFGKGNYGLYFSFWDVWLGTSRDDYPAAYEAVTARRADSGVRGCCRTS